MVYDLNGVGLVTGAASGIGKATAFGLAEEGCARLVLADINSSGVELVSSELKSLYPSAQVLCIQVDTSKQTDVQRMVDEAVKTFGAVHYAVNCAGITSNPRVVTHELPVEAWDRVLDVNLRGVWLCQKAVITQMLRQPAELGIKSVVTFLILRKLDDMRGALLP
ncbi:MAG: hypothetical protein M1820_008804 [Bogoriella megaspora]|nr:MAG: hypothetical protein M1820_008804 [Bogoriella megaspora]